jgi:hypothetical protein
MTILDRKVQCNPSHQPVRLQLQLDATFTMLSHAPPIIAPPSVLRLDWEILPRFASHQSKLLDLDLCPTLNHPPIGFMAQPINHSLLNFKIQTKKSSQWFWGPNHQTRAVDFEVKIGKPSTFVLRLNQETRAPSLHVHGTDHTWHHLTSRSPSHWVSDLCLTISGPLHRVSYSCHDPCRYPLCRTCHLHITRQANTIFHMNQRIKIKLPKCFRFEFKSQHVNDSSHIKPMYWSLGFSACMWTMILMGHKRNWSMYTLYVKIILLCQNLSLVTWVLVCQNSQVTLKICMVYTNLW